MNYAATFSAAGVIAAAIFTALSLKYLNTTGNFIGEQTEASIKQANVTSDLLNVELARDKQTNLISAYIIAEAIKKNKSSSTGTRQIRTFEISVTAHINNQSVQPIFEIVAKLHKRQRAYNGNTFLTSEDIPISVVGPRSDRPYEISESFTSSGFDRLPIFDSLTEAQEVARKIEVEYSVILIFRGADGLYYEGNMKDSTYTQIDATRASLLYETAVVNFIKKK